MVSSRRAVVRRAAGLVAALVAVSLAVPVAADPGTASATERAASRQRVSDYLSCLRPSIANVERRQSCATSLLGTPAAPTGGVGSTLPVCVNEAATLNSRCENWARAFNDRSPDGSTVNDAPGGIVSDRAGHRVFIASTSSVGASLPHVTVAALSTKNGATLWVNHPRLNLATYATTVTLSPDERTFIVAGMEKYLPNLNANPLYYLVTMAFSAANGRQLWITTNRIGGQVNTPVAVRVSQPLGAVYVASYSIYAGGFARPNVEWVTVRYSLRTGYQSWIARYDGVAGGQNYPVGLGLSPRGDIVYVAGASEHPQNTGVYSWDYGVIAYDGRTGHRRWASLTRVGADNEPVAMSVTAKGDRVVVTGDGVFGTATSPVIGLLTVAISTRNGARQWVTRTMPASGLSSTATALTVSPDGSRVYVAAAVGRREQVVPTAAQGVTGDPVRPDVVTLTILGLSARSGKTQLNSSYVPDPQYSAAPTAIATNAKGTRIYATGVVGPPTLLAVYPVTIAITSAGATAWTARYDLRDPTSIGVGLAGYPATPVGIAVDRGAGQVYDLVSWYPALSGAQTTGCRTAEQTFGPQPCSATGGQANLILAYAG